ncbi:hypothetical protein C8J57DRAFT_1244813 [Mycena rebaudengoi]|nr:hypothetical protein C8J57DRAFT_1244813 [Mycena rebaudengoi]
MSASPLPTMSNLTRSSLVMQNTRKGYVNQFRAFALAVLSILAPAYLRDHDLPRYALRSYAHSLAGGGARRGKFLGTELSDHVIHHNALTIESFTFNFEFQCPSENIALLLENNPSFIAVSTSIQDLVPILTRKEVAHTATVHGFRIYSRLNADEARNELLDHQCTSCPPILTVMSRQTQIKPTRIKKPPPPPPSEAVARCNAADVARWAARYRFMRREQLGAFQKTPFPPPPLSRLPHWAFNPIALKSLDVQFVRD